MGPEEKRLARAWMQKARSDFASARLLITGPERHLDTGVYHCQQAAEKALKAVLTAFATPFPKTHNLTELLALADVAGFGMSRHEEATIFLTPFATEFRYPGDCFEPLLEDAELALAYSESLVESVASILEPILEGGDE